MDNDDMSMMMEPAEGMLRQQQSSYEGGAAAAAIYTEAATAAAAADLNLPWVEKYRPIALQQVVSHHDIINTLKRFISREQLPHLLFHGPPGTGKTSTIQAISRQLYGQNRHQMVLELNASDDRGINVVRDTIKAFAEAQVITRAASQTGSLKPFFAHPECKTGQQQQQQQQVQNVVGSGEEFRLNRLSNIKLVVLDEADQMISAAQMALRRIIEKFTQNVRFVIICNYVNKINPALQSRCTKFRFAPLNPEDILKRTKQIAEAEGLQVSNKAYETLIKIGKGDMRKVLNSLQSAAMNNEGQIDAMIDEDKILQSVGLPLPHHVEAVLPMLNTLPFRKAFEGFQSIIKQNGYSLSDFVTALYEKLINYKLPTLAACNLYPRLAEIEFWLSKGADETIQTAALVAAFSETRQNLYKFTDEHSSSAVAK